MHDAPTTVASFRGLDEAESALDWLGLEFREGDGWFEGTLDEDAAEALEAAVATEDTPGAVRDLAAVLLEQLRDAGATRTWRVEFGA